jgi:hypothetical protein
LSCRPRRQVNFSWIKSVRACSMWFFSLNGFN